MLAKQLNISNKMRKEKIIIFDFDGVIADTLNIAFAIQQMSRPTLERERYKKLFDGNIYDAKLEDKIVNEVNFFVEFSRRLKTLGIDKRVKIIIKKLSKDFRLFIISGTVSYIINEYLAKHKLLNCFTEVLGCDIDTSKVKKFKMIFKKYRILPSEAIFITDTSGDVREAKQVKINFIIGILGGYQSKASLEKAEPDIIAKDFDDFFRLVNQG